MNWIDLRSDTVTRPTEEMRQAMASAEVGDDVYREDPTVNRLEQRSAEMLGKEAALFVPTGTMGNTIAIKMHTSHGQEVICESRAHILDWELSMMAWFAGCLARPIAAERGILQWQQIEPEIRKPGGFCAPTGLVEIENTHNMAGGSVYPLNTINEICEGAHSYGIKVHMDGARLFNAAIASNMPVAKIVANVDSVMFCLSKGLGAPAGSMLVGNNAEITQARYLRKRLGGGLRQSGVLAAPGLIALDKMTDRLVEDHENAKRLAEACGQIPGVKVDGPVETNIVIADLSGSKFSGAEFCEHMKGKGILLIAITPTKVRFVTHYDVPANQISQTIEALKTLI